MNRPWLPWPPVSGVPVVQPYVGRHRAPEPELPTCEECGNDLVCEGFRYCSECLEALEVLEQRPLAARR